MGPEALRAIETGVSAFATLIGAALICRQLRAIRRGLEHLAVVGRSLEYAVNNLNARLMSTALRRTVE